MVLHYLSCREVDAKLIQLQAERDLTRTWLHVDMDAFFAAVAERDRPDLVRMDITRGTYGRGGNDARLLNDAESGVAVGSSTQCPCN